MSASRNIAAVVVSFNAKDWIGPCLKSLLDSKPAPRVILVDNASSDGTRTIVRAAFPGVTLIENETNEGFGAANNRGIREALRGGAEGVFLLNQDATVEEEGIMKLAAVAEKHPGSGIIAPLHMTYDATRIDPHVLGYLGEAVGFLEDLVRGEPAESYELPFFPAAGWLLTRDALESVGGFDPIYFMYGEDMDYCRRVRREGLTIRLAPDAKVFHWHGGLPGEKTRTTQSLAAEEYWQLVLWLKNPDAPFGKTALLAIREQTLKLLRHAAYLDRKRFLAVVSATARAFARTGEIRRHRRLIVERTPRLFLNP